MSEENLRRVHEQYARYNAGERAPGRWFWHEDAEYHTAPEDPDHAAHRGIDAIGKLFASWLEAYPDLRLDIQQAEARGDKVFLWIRFTGHGAASGRAWSSTPTATRPSKPWPCRSSPRTNPRYAARKTSVPLRSSDQTIGDRLAPGMERRQGQGRPSPFEERLKCFPDSGPAPSTT